MSDVRSTQELLPWVSPITDGLVVCKDSSFLACFEFTGADADSVGEGEVYQVGQAADRLMSLLRDLPVTLWWTVRRERTDDYPGEVMPNEVSQMLDDEHREAFLSRSAYVNRHFLSIIWMPEKSASGMFEKIGVQLGEGANLLSAIKLGVQSTYFGKHSFAWKAAEVDRAVTDFEARLDQVESVLATLSCQRLRGRELLGFLWAQANPGKRMVPKAWNAETYLDALLSERPTLVHRDSLQFGEDDDAIHANVLSMKSWPDPLAFGALSALVSLPTELVISHCFRVMNANAALKHINNVKRMNDLLKYPLKSWLIGSLMRSGAMNESNADPARARAAAQAVEAKGEVSGGNILFGYHNLSVILLNEDPAKLEQTTQHMMRMMNASPFIGVIRESMHALSGWASSLPGQWQECRRWLTISSANLVDLAPLLGVNRGERINKHLTAQLGRRCQALTVLATDYNTPYYFNFHSGAVGHTMVVGPTRAGKSIGMNFFISQFQKYGDAARTIIFDKDYSCRIPTLLQGGDHVDLRAGGKVRLNPMLLARDKAAWPFLTRWIEQLIASRGDYNVTAEDAKEIFAAVEAVASNPDPEMARLFTVRTLLPNRLGIQLDEWVGAGKFANYFDNLEDSFSLTDFSCLEMGEVMKESRVARAVMDYAFYRLQRDLEGQRTGAAKVTMIYVEECWFLLADPYFAERLKDWLKTFAKLNAFVVLTTQSIEDMQAVPTTVFASIRDNIMTRVFLPNPMAATESLRDFYRKQFGLRDDLIDRIASAVPRQDYIVVQPDVARKVLLPLNRRQIAALRSDMAAQRIFEPLFQSRQPGWQAQYLHAAERI